MLFRSPGQPASVSWHVQARHGRPVRVTAWHGDDHAVLERASWYSMPVYSLSARAFWSGRRRTSYPFGSSGEGASRQSMTSRLLSIYLQDHHAASAGGVALARRALGPSHPFAKQIARDREALERVMRQLAVTPNALKVGTVRVAEFVGRLKLNGRLFERSPLSSVVELETLVVGVRGKEALWTALQRAGISLENVDLDALVESARAQGADLEALRLGAVARAFAPASGGISGSQAAA